MKAIIERQRILDRPEYEMPARWRLTSYQTARIGMRRQNRALRIFWRSRKARVLVRRWRLDNPFMTTEAWKILLHEAQRAQKLEARGKKPSRGTAALVPRRVA